MSNTLIVARPGDGKTRTAKELARAATERGETVVVFTTPFHTDEWKDVSGITVASDELDAALTESPTEHEDVTIIVDDIEKTLSGTAQQELERIIRTGRDAGVSTVITTSNVELVSHGTIDNSTVAELSEFSGKPVLIVDEQTA